MTARRFNLLREKDETGMSGTGTVASGVVLPNGQAVLWWNPGPSYSVGVYQSLNDLLYIHGHGDRRTTKAEWVDHLCPLGAPGVPDCLCPGGPTVVWEPEALCPHDNFPGRCPHCSQGTGRT